MADTIYGPKDQPRVTLVIPPEYYGRTSEGSQGPAVILAFPETIPGVWTDTDREYPRQPRTAKPAGVSGATVAVIAVGGAVAVATVAAIAAALLYRSKRRAPVAG
jgi:hypothetical protein